MIFRKSTHSGYNANCVEVASGWRKSSQSGTNGQCVEAASGSGTVAVRDTTDREGTVLAFSAGAWTEFLARSVRGTS